MSEACPGCERDYVPLVYSCEKCGTAICQECWEDFDTCADCELSDFEDLFPNDEEE